MAAVGMERFEPMKVLGEGSFGKVYLMREKDARRLVCVKVIKLKNIPKKERDACKKEVELLNRLNHPNIVGYRDSFLSKNKESLCIVMEYCDGGDLSDIIKKAGSQLFSEAKVLHLFVQMALGLHYMHSMRILHRDLKTQNIFLLGNGRLVLGDLGICKVLDSTSDFAKTCIGTPYYMSPEIFKNKPYNEKSDIWALGCVLYEMTTLKHAFDGSSINQLAGKICKGKYPAISSRYTLHLKDLIGAMLQVNPGDRPGIERILTLPFTKRHVGDFLSDIVNRPAGGIGEGTMNVKAAMAAGANRAEPKEVASLRAQLVQLGLQSLVSKVTQASPPPVFAPHPSSVSAAGPPSVVARRPSDANIARPSAAALEPDPAARAAAVAAREHARALEREEERSKAVAAALERLRREREERMAARNGRGAAAAMLKPAVPMQNAPQQQQQQQQQQPGIPMRKPSIGMLPVAALPQQQQPSSQPNSARGQVPRPQISNVPIMSKQPQPQVPSRVPSNAALNSNDVGGVKRVPSVAGKLGVAAPLPLQQQQSQPQLPQQLPRKPAQQVEDLEKWDDDRRSNAAIKRVPAAPIAAAPPSAVRAAVVAPMPSSKAALVAPAPTAANLERQAAVDRMKLPESRFAAPPSELGSNINKFAIDPTSAAKYGRNAQIQQQLLLGKQQKEMQAHQVPASKHSSGSAAEAEEKARLVREARKEQERKRQMDEFQRLRADKDMLDRRLAAQSAKLKAEDDEKSSKVAEQPQQQQAPPQRSQLPSQPLQVFPAPSPAPLSVPPSAAVLVRKLPSSVSSSVIPPSQHPSLSSVSSSSTPSGVVAGISPPPSAELAPPRRQQRRSESAAVLQGGAGGAQASRADILCEKIVSLAAKGVKGGAVVVKEQVKVMSEVSDDEDDRDEEVRAEERDGDSSDFSDSDLEDNVGEEEEEEEGDLALEAREAELEQELLHSTMRCNDLKATLENLRLGNARFSGDSDSDSEEGNVLLMKQAGASAIAEGDESDFDDDQTESAASDDDSEDDRENRRADNDMTPPRRNDKASVGAGPKAAGKAPSSSSSWQQQQQTSDYPPPESGRGGGNLSSRIALLRNRCVSGLGVAAFEEAYRQLKAAQDGEGEEDEATVIGKVERIVGRNRVQFVSLIEQLVFMESS